MSTQPRIPKILIISSDTGGGHRSAAAAIVAGVQKFLDSESYPRTRAGPSVTPQRRTSVSTPPQIPQPAQPPRGRGRRPEIRLRERSKFTFS